MIYFIFASQYEISFALIFFWLGIQNERYWISDVKKLIKFLLLDFVINYHTVSLGVFKLFSEWLRVIHDKDIIVRILYQSKIHFVQTLVQNSSLKSSDSLMSSLSTLQNLNQNETMNYLWHLKQSTNEFLQIWKITKFQHLWLIWRIC